ncbi:hypothetical protein M2347_001628 [Chryseobacterium sp. H1D6B]|uniref:hypothetical protein n=1 Tax=Chryseobacterium sp. H1D6B TaxID=2940588 RepID=UPI0015CAD628|nr:hypothetical protein [Chryseobacterium sp. H1D6B]MDH6251901.1 hypothetical protein [Chryseobacterium sp. H1D6B]
MKKIFFITSLLFAALYSSQVGINTTAPVNTLDINADLNVRKEIRTGGTNTVKGSAGTAGYIFHNSSDLTTNDWKNIKIADGQGSMSLFSMNTVADKTGATFSGANGATTPYTEGAALDATWTVLTGAVDKFSVTKATNKVVFTFQTTAQKTANTTASISFACGIFVDDKLTAVRTDVLLGADGTNKIFNLNATLTNVTPKNNYTVKAACVKRNLNAGTLGIGTAVNATYLNADMSQSVLTTSVLQPY